MDRSLTIAVNRADLLRIVVGIVAMMPGMAVETMPRWLHIAVLALLRPAESALRRLIAIAATAVVVGPQRKRRAAPKAKKKRGEKRALPPVFGLFDTRRNVDPKTPPAPGHGPNIRFFDGEDEMPPAATPAQPGDLVNAEALCRRLAAMLAALDDIPGQAQRLAGILARRRSKWRRVMRPGRPPGHRMGGKRAVDVLLTDCHEMALRALAEPVAPNTS